MDRYQITLKTDLSPESFKVWPTPSILINQQVDAGCTQDNFIAINPGKVKLDGALEVRKIIDTLSG